MRAVIQRVRRACVRVDGRSVAGIGPGLVVLLAVRRGDSETEARWMAEKIANLRIFPDERHHMNRSLRDAGGEAVVVSQFTLYGDARRGRRPSFVEAAEPEVAEPLCRAVADRLRALGVATQEGVFGARMEVELVNEGPVTIILDSP